MFLNTSKTEYQLFLLAKKLLPKTWKYGSKLLASTETATYPRVKLDRKLSWSQHAEKLAKKGKQRISHFSIQRIEMVDKLVIDAEHLNVCFRLKDIRNRIQSKSE